MLRYFSEAASTQDLLKAFSPPVSGEMFGVYTFCQHSGRGQAGNAWYGGEGLNVALSLGICPDFIDSGGLFLLNMALSLGALAYARERAADCCLKWPNDLYIGKKKLGGILFESRLQGAEVVAVYYGIGWNVNQRGFPASLPGAVSLFQNDGKVRDLHQESFAMYRHLEMACRECRQACRSGSYQEQFSRYRDEYKASLLGYGRWESCVFQGDPVVARISDVDDCGRLVLETREGKWIKAGIKELKFGSGA